LQLPGTSGPVVKQLSFHNVAEVWHSSATSSHSKSPPSMPSTSVDRPIQMHATDSSTLLCPTVVVIRRSSAPNLLPTSAPVSAAFRLSTVGAALHSPPIASLSLRTPPHSMSCCTLPAIGHPSNRLHAPPFGAGLESMSDPMHEHEFSRQELYDVHKHQSDWDDLDDDLDDDEQDEWICLLINSPLWKWLAAIQRGLRAMVDHRYFQRLILLAILFNTLGMGIEYHDQPKQLTQAVEYSNLFFTGVFACEMLLKLLAHGCYDYINDGFNVFDGIVVMVR
jgi:hypothetical protein